MSRNYLKYLVAVFMITVFINNGSAQYYKYTVSAGANHERLNEAYGNHLRMYYNFSDNFMINSEFARYYEVTEKTETEAIGHDFRSLTFSANYAIIFGDNLGIYAILGFDYTFGRQVTVNDGEEIERFKESVGMNAGFGAFYKIGRFRPYIESRNVSSTNSYLIFGAGIAYSFGKHE